jgi:O-antigen/teichoic acid export membrane protein
MKIKLSNLVKKSTILSIPGLISILISLSSIPIHLNLAGPENYGNYIIFHFILMLSVNLNLGIGKSTTISINNYPKERKKVSFKAIEYTKNISNIIFCTFGLLILINYLLIKNSDFYEYSFYLFLGAIITVFFITIEGILQGNRKFEIISIINLFFFSLSFSVPSLLLIIDNSLSFYELIKVSVLMKFLTVILIFCYINNKNFVTKSKNNILILNLKKNSKWITINGILVQFYDLFDKYLIKFFLGPVALATYSVPQQLTGKLSVISKSFSAFLLPDLSKKKINNNDFEYSLNIFICIIPVLIFLLFPFYSFILKTWLSNSFNEQILILTKTFSLCAIFACASHILVTKFEATKTLKKNLKIELILMPIFLISLIFLISAKYSLVTISFLILTKEYVLFILRMNFLKNDIKNIKKYCWYSLFLLLILFLSFFNENLFYLCVVILTIGNLMKD